jgi:catechol 2,3-dioxygenase-like lactoylglutathione lyase family enzyme
MGERSLRAQPLIAVRDVAASSRWYQALLGCDSGHGGDEYERLVKDGELVLQLHAWGAHDHPDLIDPDAARHGYGVLLWFEIDAFDAAVGQARGLGAEIVQPPFVNPRAGHRECWLRDPDGYVIVLASRAGDVAAATTPAEQGVV